MITLKATSCRLLDKDNRGVTLYKVVTKVTDGKSVATFRRYRLIVSWDEMSDRKRREYFREEVNEELFEVLNKYDTLQEHFERIEEELAESIERSHKNFEAYQKCVNSAYGFWELYGFGE